MIPKIIHYCWFGRNPLPKSALKCIASWRKFLPDYEIKEWNEDNFDVNIIPYTSFCYENRLWAYLSDFVRLSVVEQMGGIYFDTDVELIKYPKELLSEDGCLGWEQSNWINTGLGFAAKPHHCAIKSMMKAYEERTTEFLHSHFQNNHSLTGCPRMNTFQLLPYGVVQDGSKQKIVVDGDTLLILPADYMCPFDDIIGKLNLTKNTFSIHWYTKSANGKYALLRSRLSRPIHKLLNLFKEKK